MNTYILTATEEAMKTHFDQVIYKKAALGSLPKELEIVIKQQFSNGSHTLGYINGIDTNHILEEKTYWEWSMLVLLSGEMGEKIAFGGSTFGNHDDYSKWVNIAKKYLSNNFDGIYYPEPETELEQISNNNKLEALQSKQKKLLQQLFDENLSVYHSLRESLIEHKRLDYKQLSSFLKKILLPKDFPKPLGNFSEFGESEWPYHRGYKV